MLVAKLPGRSSDAMYRIGFMPKIRSRLSILSDLGYRFTQPFLNELLSIVRQDAEEFVLGFKVSAHTSNTQFSRYKNYAVKDRVFCLKKELNDSQIEEAPFELSPCQSTVPDLPGPEDESDRALLNARMMGGAMSEVGMRGDDEDCLTIRQGDELVFDEWGISHEGFARFLAQLKEGAKLRINGSIYLHHVKETNGKQHCPYTNSGTDMHYGRFIKYDGVSNHIITKEGSPDSIFGFSDLHEHLASAHHFYEGGQNNPALFGISTYRLDPAYAFNYFGFKHGEIPTVEIVEGFSEFPEATFSFDFKPF